MNWKKIKKKYPKGVNKLFDWLFIFEYNSRINKETGTQWYQFERGYLKPCEGFAWDIRNLYDFFDEQGIYIGLDYHYALGIERWFTASFTYGKSEYYKTDFKTGIRKEAEEIAFLKAFEILEKAETQQETKKVKS